MMPNGRNICLRLLAPKRAALLDEKIVLYQKIIDPDEILQYQIHRFNRVWSKALATLSFYQDWAMEHQLPSQVASVEELKKFPALTKEIIRKRQKQISRDVADFKGLYYTSTGGSAGVPVRFPTTKAEKVTEYANTYMGKSWWGIEPFDYIIHLWGHSHLFGTGWRGKIKEWRRCLYDRVIRTRRLNAYNMSGDRIRQYAKIITNERPEVISGYTSALFKIAQYAKSNGISLSHRRLKGVIVTAETATGSDIALLAEVFARPVIIEYGMAETGVISYSRDETENCIVFWDSFLCHEDVDGMRVSTLYDRCFPLINYQTKDMLAEPVCFDGSVLRFTNIKGRVQESLTLRSADQQTLYIVSGILIVHILKSQPGIYSVASIQVADGVVKVQITAESDIKIERLTEYLRLHLADEFGPISTDAVTVVQASKTESTLAGKDRVVIGAIR